jgi:serine phosphatase RsbU (regulator of sigma subunit)
MVRRDRARLLAEIALERARAASARLDAELDAAWAIQQGFLPPAERRIEGRLDLACRIRPARRVGGDFYDHFMVDDRRLFFVLGDVSGKGIEASVFMGLSKALWKSAALRAGLPLDLIQAAANADIARDNPSMMFVTGFAGLLDLRTGELHFSSAGHESPFVLRPGAPPLQAPDAGGPPAGLDPDAAYPVGAIRLAAGEGLCLFSDGVNEAENEAGELYGLPRGARLLAGLPRGAGAQDVVEALCADVDRFVGAAPPSDDLAVMVLIRPPDREAPGA